MMRTSTYRLSAEFIAESCGGRVLMGQGLVAEGGASIDSRTIRSDEVFFAIRGPRFDGHDFLEQAVSAGAVGLVVDEAHRDEASRVARTAAGRVFVVAVSDTERALVKAASSWVDVLMPTVIGITGSVGKSTTKDLTAAVCGARFNVAATAGNLNNRLGFSLTCLRLLPCHEFLVAEMGMNAPGEIAELCTIARPQIGVVTCVAPVHLEGLGNLDAVARAKAEIIEALPADGVAVLNLDDPRVAAMRGLVKGRCIGFGHQADADVRILDVSSDADGHPTVSVEVAGRSVSTRLMLIGAHQAHNAAAALAVGLAVGVDPDAAALAMEKVGPGRHRMNLVDTGRIRVLDDCYNASPRSMSAALDALVGLAGPQRTVAVLGDMLELGTATEEAHRDLGREAAERQVGRILAVGRFSHLIREGALTAGFSGSAMFEALDAISAASVAIEIVRAGDVVLVKGSRGVGLERVVGALTSRFVGVDADEGN